MSIKVCTYQQLALLRDISIETYRDTFIDSNSELLMQKYLDKALTQEKLENEFNNSGSRFYFITVQEQVAGFFKVNEVGAQTDIYDPDALEIERFYIRQGFFRQGVGRQSMEYIFYLAKQSNKKYVWLGVWEKNYRALSFYKRMGFEQSGSHPFDMGGDIQTDLVLKKTL